MTFGFTLSFDELDEDLQQEKIDLYIEYLYNAGEYGDDFTSAGEALADQSALDNARSDIEARFPIRF